MQSAARILFLLFSFAFAAEAQVVINEIMYNPPEPGTDTLEYLELHNAGSQTVDLTGWYFQPGPAMNLEGQMLPPGGYLVICKNVSYYEGIFGPVGYPLLQWNAGALSNSGQTLTLHNNLGEVVTSVAYATTQPWPAGAANGQGASIVLCDPTGDNGSPANWRLARTATGIVHYNRELLANPGAASSCAMPQEFGLVLSGVFDAQPSTVGARGVELFVREDIADLSIYGLGSANNGGGTNGEEFTFPAISANAGDYLYVAADSALFHQFFGFDAHFISTAMNINGDDAIELFEEGEVIDVFGNIFEDGTGTPWDYQDGWAYRVDGTGPDGSIFELNNWFFSGVGGLTGSPTNAGSKTPMPIGTYRISGGPLKANDDMVSTPLNTEAQFAVLVNDYIPAPLTLFEILDSPLQGAAAVTGEVILYQPFQDYCGPDALTYRICDANGCDTAQVAITVICPKNYPAYPIGLVRTVDAEGVLDSLGITCALEGVVYGVNLRPGGLQFTIIDDNQDGIAVFSTTSMGYTVKEGDRVVVQGELFQFNGLAQIQPVSVVRVAENQQLHPAVVVSELNEWSESRLVRLEAVYLVDPMEWTNAGPGFNVRVSNGSQEYSVRIDNDVNLYGAAPPQGIFNLTGIGTQFSANVPFLDGYQIMPRYQADIDIIQSTKDVYADNGLTLWPNPVQSWLKVETAFAMAEVQILDALGRLYHHQRFGQGEVRQWEWFPVQPAPGWYTLKALDTRGNVQARLFFIGG